MHRQSVALRESKLAVVWSRSRSAVLAGVLAFWRFGVSVANPFSKYRKGTVRLLELFVTGVAVDCDDRCPLRSINCLVSAPGWLFSAAREQRRALTAEKGHNCRTWNCQESTRKFGGSEFDE